MADNVLGTLFGDIASAIREKNAEAGTMKPIQFPEKIRGIEGKSPELRWVTFMSYDGLTEYGKKAVAVGDDCADPIARDVFDTPTRESTEQYNYTFAGWSTVVNGGLDTNALKAVEEDRTVYANFAAVTRTYTIRFMDGDSVLESKEWLYGSTPSIANPEKSGYSFDRWEPAITAVTGDADYYAQWTEALTFAGGSWADIAAVSEAGKAAEYFAVGDTKIINADGKDITLRIIGFNHDMLADGSGKAGITIWSETALSDTMAIDNWQTLAANMRTKLKPKLPSDLQAVIKAVAKECDTYNANNQTIVDTPVSVDFDLFPLSFAECKITKYGSVTGNDFQQRFTPLGTAYQYFENVHNTTWCGPYNSKWETGNWMRQWLTHYDFKGVYTDRNVSTSSVKWGALDTNTTLRKVMLAFCI